MVLPSAPTHPHASTYYAAMTRIFSHPYRIAGLPIAALAMLVLLATLAPQTVAAQSDDPEEREIRRNYSLYWEDFQNENYAMALPNLQWILDNAPQFPRDDDRNFRRAIEAHENLAERADDEEARMEHLREALDLLENAPERIKELELGHDEFRWARMYGRFLQMYGRHFDADELPKTEVDAYLAAYELDHERLDPYFIERIVQGLVERDRQQALDFMDRLENERDDDEIAELITETRDGLFDTPEERYDFIVSRLDGDPENPELLRERYTLEERLGKRDQMYETAEKLLEIEPSAQAFYDVGTMYMDDGEESEALARFERALEQGDITDELRVDIEFDMGTAYRQQGNLQRARRHFRNVLDIDSSHGHAYLAIGDLYTQQVADCEGPLERQDRAVYWLAVEYYERAKNADRSIERQANQKIQTFQRFFPNQEAIFFRDDWEVGESFRIDYGCYSWINETTTVRSPV